MLADLYTQNINTTEYKACYSAVSEVQCLSGWRLDDVEFNWRLSSLNHFFLNKENRSET